MFRTSQLLLVIVILLMVPMAVQAASIPWLTNTTTNTVIFDDNLEPSGGVVGAPPVATTGSWSFFVTSPSTTVVADLSTAGFAANEGNQFFQMIRSPSKAEAHAHGVAANSGAGDTIKLEMAFRSSGSAISVLLPLTGTTENGEIGFFPDGTVGSLNDGANWTITPQTHNTGIWNRLVLTHVNDGSNLYQISINGAAPTAITAPWGTGNFNGVEMAAALNGSVLSVDSIAAVPEPSTVAMLVSGMTGLLACARRQQKEA